MSVPYPDPVFVQALTALDALATVHSVSTTLYDVLPAVRVAKVRDHEAPSDWEATPIYQVEVWADDEFQAGEIAWAVKNEWPSAHKQVVGSALITHRWVDLDPLPFPDVETDKPRHIVHLGLRLSGVSS